MPLPNLEDICVELVVTPRSLSVTFPGGAALDAQLPDIGISDPMQLATQLMAQANAALAPLSPVFNIIDTALALHQAVKAIPDAISSLDPGKISDALPDLTRKAGKLAALVPQLSVPLMIVGLIDVLLTFLGGLAGQLRAIIDHQMRIQRAENRAAELGNAQLQVVADCSKHHVDAQMLSLIKLDIEGAEPLAIAGMRETLRAHRPAVIVELNATTLSRAGFPTREPLDRLLDAVPDYRPHVIAWRLKRVRDVERLGEVNLLFQ